MRQEIQLKLHHGNVQLNTYSTCIWNLYIEILQFDIGHANLKSYPYAKKKCASLLNNFNGALDDILKIEDDAQEEHVGNEGLEEQ